jgi:hypothetical protein
MHRSAPFALTRVDLARKRAHYALVHRRLREDPFLRLDSSPVDDEPVTAEEEAAIAKVERDRAAGVPTIPFDDVKRAHSES